MRSDWLNKPDDLVCDFFSYKTNFAGSVIGQKSSKICCDTDHYEQPVLKYLIDMCLLRRKESILRH